MFDDLKAEALRKLGIANQNKEVDEQVIPILEIINSKDDFFTSSSCYGRIYFMDVSKSKKDSRFLAKWHRKVSFEEVKKELDKAEGNVWFRFEPLILHISCRDIESAKKIIEIKTRLIRRGGIFQISDNRTQIELIGANRVDLPVKENNQILVTDEYLEKIVETANSKFEDNEKLWGKLENEFTQL